MNHKAIITSISFLIITTVIGGTVYFQWQKRQPVMGPPPAEAAAVSLGSGKLWIGLKNSDDQGTQFDLRADVYKNNMLVASGQTLCITGVTRNPDKAQEVTVPFGSITNGNVVSGDVLSLKIFTRIGTKAGDTQCPGHSNAVGLRLYYDATTRPSRFGLGIPPASLKDYFLRSGSTDFLDTSASTAVTAKFKDSPSVNFKSGNPWQAIGTWSIKANISIVLPPDPGEAGKATLAGIDSDHDGVRDDIQRYIVLTYPDSAKTRAALIQVAKTMQKELLDASDKQASAADVPAGVNATLCLEYVVTSSNVRAIFNELRARILNTRERSADSILFNQQLGGQGIGLPSADPKSFCAFNPDTLEN